MPARSRVCSAHRVTKPSRHAVSTSSAEATPDSTRRAASLPGERGNESRSHESGDITVDDDTRSCQRPRRSLRTLHGVVSGLVAPDQLAQPHHRHREKVCPTTLSGRVTAAICVMGMALVFVASTASHDRSHRGPENLVLHCNVLEDSLDHDGVANSIDVVVVVIRASAASASSCVRRPLSTKRPIDVSIPPMPRASASSLTSREAPPANRPARRPVRFPTPQPGTDDANGLLKTR